MGLFECVSAWAMNKYYLRGMQTNEGERGKLLQFLINNYI